MPDRQNKRSGSKAGLSSGRNTMGNKKYGNDDSREKGRTLSEAEQRRLAAFEELSKEMEEKGYRRTELTISIVKANVFAVALLVPLFAVGLWLYYAKNGGFHNIGGPALSAALLGAIVILVPLHELIHGLSWALYTGNGFKDIEFGFMKQYLTPYCTCAVPLSKGQYVFGALMPLVILGIVPMIAGILLDSFITLIIGIVMADSAAGDIMIVWNILRYKSSADDIVYIDHPTQGGGVIFER